VLAVHIHYTFHLRGALRI